MKKTALPVLIAIVLMSCGSGEDAGNKSEDIAPDQNQPVKPAEVPVPADVDKKFTKIINEYQQKISNDFWSDFQSTTRRGGKGTTEVTFDATAFDKYMKKKGFSLIPNKMMDYTGTVDGIDVSIAEKTVSGEKGGWIHQWTIKVESSTDAGIFNKQHEFAAAPAS